MLENESYHLGDTANILVVEDEYLVSQDIVFQLQAAGFENVEAVRSFQGAIEKIDAVPPDIALLDIRISGQASGIDIGKELRKRGDIPFVYLTAFADSDTLRRAVATCPDGYLLKPIEEGTLETTVAEVLKRQRSKRAHQLAEARARELEHQLLQMQKLDAIGNLTAGIAHELNNALLVVVGNLALAQGIIESGGYLSKYIETAKDACARCTKMIRELLGFARHGVVNQKPQLLEELVRDGLEFLEKILAVDVRILFEGDDSDPIVDVDAEKLHQVLCNVLLNAQHSMPSGGTISIRLFRETVENAAAFNADSQCENFVVLAIKDEGCGMDAVTKERVFEPFFSTKPMEEGTGMGLSVVYGIMQSHGGWVRIESEVDSGTEVLLYFPEHESSLSSANINGVESPAIGTVPSRGRILVIDDEPVIAQMMKRILIEKKCRPKVFSSASEALKWFTLHHAEVENVILDMKMSEASGLKVFMNLKEIDPKCGIYLFSGYAQDASVREALRLGACGFYEKPTDLERLLGEVAKGEFEEKEVE